MNLSTQKSDPLAYKLCAYLVNTREAMDPELLGDPLAFQQYNYRGGYYVLKSFPKKYQSLQGLTVLDWGCGDGGKSVYYVLEAQAKHVSGVELLSEKIKAAVALAQKKEIEAQTQFIVGNGEELPFADQHFDRIVSNSAFEHVDETIILKCLSECYRVLKPEGKALIRFHPYNSRWGSHLQAYLPIPWIQHFFSEAILVKLWKERYWHTQATARDCHYKPEDVKQWQSIADISHLNLITSARFEQFCRQAGFRFEYKAVSNSRWSRHFAHGILKDHFADHMIYVLTKK